MAAKLDLIFLSFRIREAHIRAPRARYAASHNLCFSLLGTNILPGHCRFSGILFPRILAIGLLQLTITWYKIRHAGGQAHYYSRTGTLKQRDLNQSSLTCLCFNVPVRE